MTLVMEEVYKAGEPSQGRKQRLQQAWPAEQSYGMHSLSGLPKKEGAGRLRSIVNLAGAVNWLPMATQQSGFKCALINGLTGNSNDQFISPERSPATTGFPA